MAATQLTLLAQLVGQQETAIVADWLAGLRASGALQTGRIKETELQLQCTQFLEQFRTALAEDQPDINAQAFGGARSLPNELSRSRAMQGFTPRETASFIFSLKQPLFNGLSRAPNINAEQLAQLIWEATLIIDALGLYTVDVYQKAREELIVRQQREISELSTPVVKLWDGVLALPLIGTLDSERTQVVMESLLQSIVDQGAEIAIIDITGVPTVDTLTAQHLLKTIAAARLMGADCIVSGIRPQIAQTMVHLGVELNVISKATLADAFAVALRRMNRAVVAVKPSVATHTTEQRG